MMVSRRTNPLFAFANSSQIRGVTGYNGRDNVNNNGNDNHSLCPARPCAATTTAKATTTTTSFEPRYGIARFETPPRW